MAAIDHLEEPLEHEIDPEVQKRLQKHPGKWVAITRSEVLAVGDSPTEVYEKARAGGVENPIVLQVPNTQHAVYFF